MDEMRVEAGVNESVKKRLEEIGEEYMGWSCRKNGR